MCDIFYASGHVGNASATYTHEYDLNNMSLPVLPNVPSLYLPLLSPSHVIRRSSRRPLPPPVRLRRWLVAAALREGRKGSRVSQRCMNVISRKGGRVSGGEREGGRERADSPFPLSHSHFCSPLSSFLPTSLCPLSLFLSGVATACFRVGKQRPSQASEGG